MTERPFGFWSAVVSTALIFSFFCREEKEQKQRKAAATAALQRKPFDGYSCPEGRRRILSWGPGYGSSWMPCIPGGVAPPQRLACQSSEGVLFQARWSGQLRRRRSQPGPTPRAGVLTSSTTKLSGLAREPSPSQALK